MLQPLDRSMRPRIALALVEIAMECLNDDVAHQRALSAAADARDAYERAQRKLDIDVLQVIVRGAENLQKVPVPLATLGRNFDLLLTRQVFSRQTVCVFDDFARGPLHYQFATAHTRPGAKVDDLIG